MPPYLTQGLRQLNHHVFAFCTHRVYIVRHEFHYQVVHLGVGQSEPALEVHVVAEHFVLYLAQLAETLVQHLLATQ